MLLAVETVELVSQLFLLLEELLLAGGIRLSSSARGIQRHTETIADKHIKHNAKGGKLEGRPPPSYTHTASDLRYRHPQSGEHSSS